MAGCSLSFATSSSASGYGSLSKLASTGRFWQSDCSFLQVCMALKAEKTGFGSAPEEAKMLASTSK